MQILQATRAWKQSGSTRGGWTPVNEIQYGRSCSFFLSFWLARIRHHRLAVAEGFLRSSRSPRCDLMECSPNGTYSDECISLMLRVSSADSFTKRCNRAWVMSRGYPAGVGDTVAQHDWILIYTAEGKSRTLATNQSVHSLAHLHNHCTSYTLHTGNSSGSSRRDRLLQRQKTTTFKTKRGCSQRSTRDCRH